MAITHQHVMTGSEPADSNMVGPAKWNAAHSSPAISDVTGLQTALDGKSASGHSHSGLAPAGGGAATVLKKISGTDYDYSWQADSTGAAIAFREFVLVSGGAVFTNLGAAFTEAGSQVSRNRLDLTGFTDFRITFVMTVAATTGDVKLQYATTSNFASPVDLIQNDNPGANTFIESAWTTIPAGAKADVYFRVGMLNGNTTEDPNIRQYRLQVR